MSEPLVANKTCTYIDLMLLDYKEVRVIQRDGKDYIENGPDLYEIGDTGEDDPFAKLLIAYGLSRITGRVRIIRADDDHYLGVILVCHPRKKKKFTKVVFRAGCISKELENI